MRGKGASSSVMQINTTIMRINMDIPQKTNIKITFDATISLPSTFLKDLKAIYYTTHA